MMASRTRLWCAHKPASPVPTMPASVTTRTSRHRSTRNGVIFLIFIGPSWYVRRWLQLASLNPLDSLGNRLRAVEDGEHRVVRTRLARPQPDHRTVRPCSALSPYGMCRRLEPNGVGAFSQVQPLKKVRELLRRPLELQTHLNAIIDHDGSKFAVFGGHDVVHIDLLDEPRLRG